MNGVATAGSDSEYASMLARRFDALRASSQAPVSATPS